MLENKVSNLTVSVLSENFNISKEVYCVTNKNRIDLVGECKDSGAVFGMELKHMDRKRGQDFGKHIRQAQRYAHADFNINGNIQKIPIFLIPPISYNYLIFARHKRVIDGVEYFADRHDKNHPHHTVNGMLGELGVGEVRTFTYNCKQEYNFTFSNKIIFSSISGIHETNYNNLITKINDNSF
jgi:hypothetical protein